MGYYSTRRKREGRQRVGPVELACIVLVVAAVIALVVWMVATAGGGVLMN